MSERPPTERPQRPPRTREPSLVLVATGHGKGKTTAALGTLMRAVARGWKVAVVQFIKSGKWKVGEEETARTLGVDWWSIGDGFTWNSEDMDRTEAVAREAWNTARDKIASGAYDLVVLDEVTYAINWGWIPLEEVVAAIGSRPATVNVFLTGRDAPDELIEAADTVTEMVNVKHAFDAGAKAVRGLDF